MGSAGVTRGEGGPSGPAGVRLVQAGSDGGHMWSDSVSSGQRGLDDYRLKPKATFVVAGVGSIHIGVLDLSLGHI